MSGLSGSTWNPEWAGFSSCCILALQLRSMGFVALQHVGSYRSLTRNGTQVPCMARLNHWTTREVPLTSFF